MAPAKKGGKRGRRAKNPEGATKELLFKEEEQEYGQVLKMLGNGRCDVYCIDGVKRLCHIRGKMRKRVWINTGDIVLVSLRDFQDEKADIIAKYSADEARQLKNYGELPENVKINETDLVKGEFSDDGIEFADWSDSEGEKEVKKGGKNEIKSAPTVATGKEAGKMASVELPSGAIDLDAI
jgi:translation initiation factor 1A